MGSRKQNRPRFPQRTPGFSSVVELSEYFLLFSWCMSQRMQHFWKGLGLQGDAYVKTRENGLFSVHCASKLGKSGATQRINLIYFLLGSHWDSLWRQHCLTFIKRVTVARLPESGPDSERLLCKTDSELLGSKPIALDTASKENGVLFGDKMQLLEEVKKEGISDEHF